MQDKQISKTIAIALSAVVALSCAGGASSASPSALRTVVHDASGVQSLYSFRYNDSERVLYVYIPAYEQNLTCSTVGSQKLDTAWYIELSVNWPAPLDSVSLAAPLPFRDASVAVVRADALTRSHWTVYALGGKVTFRASPVDEAAQIAGADVRGHIDFTLPLQPRSEADCVGSASDAGIAQGCTCDDLQGVPSTCVKTDETSCCEPPTAASETVSLDFVAAPCGLFCVVTPGSSHSCDVLL